MNKLEISIDKNEKKMSIIYDGARLDRYAYKNMDDIVRVIEEYLDKEIIDFCPLCDEPIYDDEETMNDESNSYGGICHESCFLEAQESRLN